MANGIPKMEIRNGKKSRPTQVVYVQFRQARRDKEGKMVLVSTKTITISNATIAEVEALLRKSIGESLK